MLTEMNGEPWSPTAQHQDKSPQARGVYITLERQIKYGGTKGCAACFGDAKIHSLECRTRFQDIVDNEAAQTAAAGASEPNVEAPGQAAGGFAVRAVAQHRRQVDPRRRMPTWKLQSSAGQPTSYVKKRQKLMAGMPILHETDVDDNMDAHKLVDVAAMPDDQGKWTQRVIDWDKKYYGAKRGSVERACEHREAGGGGAHPAAGGPSSESGDESGSMMRKRRWRTRMRSGTDWLQHRKTRTPARM